MEQVEVKFDHNHAQVLLEESKQRLDVLRLRITQGDLTEFKSLSNPPKIVGDLAYAVLALLGHRNFVWGTFKAEINIGSRFGQRLARISVDMIDDATMRRVTQYVNPPEFNVDRIKAVSAAAASLGEWLISFIRYWRDYKQINSFIQLAQDTK